MSIAALSPAEWEVISLSLKVALWSVAVSLPFARAVAWLLARTSFPGKSLFDALVQHCLDSLVQRLEAVLWQRRFNALGALALDRDLRTLVGGLSGLAPRTVRDKFARLTQIASCLGLEAPEEILDYWGDNAGAVTWRLQPAEVRRALGLRLEFRQEAIVSLRL